MKKFILIILILLSSLYADFVNTLSSKNLAVLNSFNIDSNFIQDKQTNQLFNLYSKRRKKYFLNVLENGYNYIPLIKGEIQKAHIPASLIFVAMAESYFTTKARSDKRAVGLWQFIPSTARRFGLKINTYVDERRDPIKSTIAAIKYLSELKKQTGKWYLAIMSYNCGEARVIEGITRAKLDKYCSSHKCDTPTIHKYRKMIAIYQHTNNFRDLDWVYRKVKKLYPKSVSLEFLLRKQPHLKRQYLPHETRTYIRKIIAMSFLLNSDNFVQYQNHYLLNRGSISNLVKVNVPAGTSLWGIARMLHMDYRTLRDTNLHLKYGFTPPHEDSYIYIPYQKLAIFKMKFRNKHINRKIVYTVHRGDTLASIGHKFELNYKIIKDFNHLHSNFLKINQKLIIPIRHHIKIEKKVAYRVKSGDSLRSIAKKFHTSYLKIKRLNRLSSDLIYKNQKLIVPTYITLN